MNKILLIPSILTISAIPMIATISCSNECYCEMDQYFDVGDEEGPIMIPCTKPLTIKANAKYKFHLDYHNWTYPARLPLHFLCLIENNKFEEGLPNFKPFNEQTFQIEYGQDLDHLRALVKGNLDPNSGKVINGEYALIKATQQTYNYPEVILFSEEFEASIAKDYHFLITTSYYEDYENVIFIGMAQLG